MRNKDNLFSEVSDTQEEIKSYIQNTIDLTKLHIAKDISKILTQVTSKLIIFYILFFVLMFVSIAGAFAIATYTKSYETGFLSIAALYFILAIVTLFFRKMLIEKPIIKTIVHLFFPNFSKYDK